MEHLHDVYMEQLPRGVCNGQQEASLSGLHILHDVYNGLGDHLHPVYMEDLPQILAGWVDEPWCLNFIKDIFTNEMCLPAERIILESSHLIA